MKVKLSFFCLATTALLTVFFSCKKMDSTPACDGNFQNGVFITCEGPFQNGTGTVSFSSDELTEPCADIFSKLNSGAALGNIVQSMTLIGDKAYIVVNNANKIVVVEAKTFHFLTEITGLALPRYVLDIGGGKAFVSQWGLGGLSGSVAVLNLTTNQIEKTISGVGSGCERMVKSGDAVFVANSGGFGVDSTITKISLSTNSVSQSIFIGAYNPTSFATATDGSIWVLSKGKYDFLTGVSTAGSLVKIEPSTGQVLENTRLTTANGSDDLSQNAAGDLFFSDFSGIQRLKKGSAATDLFASGSFYEIAVSPTGQIWATDAKDFASAGEVSVFKVDGTKRNTFSVGIAPGGIVFQ